MLAHRRVRAAFDGALVPCDFTALWAEKRAAHLAGTREWAFFEVLAWLDDPSQPALFWLMGSGGTGKTVLSAELLGRLFDLGRAAAWHFCRHDNKAQSTPASLLRSLAAMLCHTLNGFQAALGEVPAATETDPKELFAALFEAPLRKMAQPEKPMLIVLDALDELPKEGQKSLLSVIAGQLSLLPPWLRLFLTSREEPQIKAALSKFEPRELRADEAKNRADVEIYLRKIASKHVKGKVSMADIERDANRIFNINITGKLVELQLPMERSRETYRTAWMQLEAMPGFGELLEFPQLRPDATQKSDDFEIVYSQAHEAQAVLTAAVATEWETDPDPKLSFLKHPVKGTTCKEWIELADDPGVKGRCGAPAATCSCYDGDGRAGQ